MRAYCIPGRVVWPTTISWKQQIEVPCSCFYQHWSKALPPEVRAAGKLIYEGFVALFGRDDVLS